MSGMTIDEIKSNQTVEPISTANIKGQSVVIKARDQGFGYRGAFRIPALARCLSLCP
jgi:hypothetical protein